MTAAYSYMPQQYSRDFQALLRQSPFSPATLFTVSSILINFNSDFILIFLFNYSSPSLFHCFSNQPCLLPSPLTGSTASCLHFLYASSSPTFQPPPLSICTCTCMYSYYLIPRFQSISSLTSCPCFSSALPFTLSRTSLLPYNPPPNSPARALT